MAKVQVQVPESEFYFTCPSVMPRPYVPRRVSEQESIPASPQSEASHPEHKVPETVPLSNARYCCQCGERLALNNWCIDCKHLECRNC